MTPLDLFLRLIAGGCSLSLLAGERLRVHDPQHILTDELRQAIRTHKAALLAMLTPERRIPLPRYPAVSFVEQDRRVFVDPEHRTRVFDLLHEAVRVANDQGAEGWVVTGGVALVHDERRTERRDRLLDAEVVVVQRERQVAHHARLQHDAGGERRRRLGSEGRRSFDLLEQLRLGVTGDARRQPGLFLAARGDRRILPCRGGRSATTSRAAARHSSHTSDSRDRRRSTWKDRA